MAVISGLETKTAQSLTSLFTAAIFHFLGQGVAMTQFVVRMWPSRGEEPSDPAFHSGQCGEEGKSLVLSHDWLLTSISQKGILRWRLGGGHLSFWDQLWEWRGGSLGHVIRSEPFSSRRGGRENKAPFEGAAVSSEYIIFHNYFRVTL